MACPRCGSNCTCACSGDPLPSPDWRRQVSLQVRAHKVRKRRRLDPDAPLLDFQELELTPAEESEPLTTARRPGWNWEEPQVTIANAQISEPEITAGTNAPVEEQHYIAVAEAPARAEQSLIRERIEYDPDPILARPPLAPFPRINGSVPKIIEFPRSARQYELAEPVADQLRIFEAIEELPPPPTSHLADIEIAPEEPNHLSPADLEVPIQAAPLGLRAYATAVDAALLIGALMVFAFSAEFFASSVPMTKPLLAGAAACGFLLLSLYYLLSFSLRRNTIGIEAAGLQPITFSRNTPSRARLRWRALATVLSYAALGMGFAWALIDEDRLCWHDRITHTYLTSK